VLYAHPRLPRCLPTPHPARRHSKPALPVMHRATARAITRSSCARSSARSGWTARASGAARVSQLTAHVAAARSRSACQSGRHQSDAKREAKWAALLPIGVTVDVLEEVLPLQANRATLYRHAQQVAERLEGELGDEQPFFIEGCQRDWDALPWPDGPLTVGIDGGYVHARDGDNRTAGWFELWEGKSVPADGAAKCFGFVTSYDTKPKRRLAELLKAQGLQNCRPSRSSPTAATTCATCSCI